MSELRAALQSELGAVYFAFGETDVCVIADLPDSRSPRIAQRDWSSRPSS